MSLALNAAPFSENNNDMNDNLSPIEKRKKNRTIKKPIYNETPEQLSPNVSNMMKYIHNKTDDDDSLYDFQKENYQNSPVSNKGKNNEHNTAILNEDKPVSVEAFTKLPRDSSSSDYYQQYVPNIPNYYNKINEGSSSKNPELLEKLNYMIYLLEEQQNEKTGHVTEEIILYSFLGVFIIFVLDSFARAGKYIR